MPFSRIWDAVTAHFFDSGRLNQVIAMSQAETQVESWWKQEFIGLFNQLKANRTILSWEREYLTGEGRKKVDFKIDLGNTSALLEVKTALCGLQKGTRWKLPNYVMAVNSGYILTDVLKLAATQSPNRQLVVFAYTAPPESDWQTVLSDIRRKAPNIAISLPRVDTSPAGELSIGWLQVA
jgi:hypothetical protein